jgi:ADP-heptose:LPS heptosyltransferase
MKRKKLLAIRFSAMGDVAMASIVAKAAMDSDEDLELDFLSKPFFEPLFEKMPGFRFLKPDLKLRHRGIIGLYKLYRDLKTNKYHAVADLHGSLRSRILGFFFRMGGTPVYTIDKGRSEKRRLIREGAHKTGALKHSVHRFADVFQRAGVKANTEKLPLPSLGTATSRVEALLKKKGGQKWIGIASFAAHTSKEWDF